MENTYTKKKSFWKKPESLVNMLFLGAIGTLVFYFWGKIVPFVLATLTNTIYMVIALVVLGALIYVLTDKRLRTLAKYFYDSMVQGLTGAFIERNPIKILKTYLGHLHKKQNEIMLQIDAFKGEMGKLDRAIKKNATDMQKELDFAASAKKQGRQNHEIAVYTRQAERLNSSNKKMMPIYTRMEKMYTYLNKMYEATSFFIADTENQIRTKEHEYEATKKSHSVMKEARAILAGKDSDKQMFDQTMQFLEDDMGRKVGEIERFMDMSKSYLDRVDIENGAFEEEGLRMLEEMLSKDPALLGTGPVSTNIVQGTQVRANSNREFNDGLQDEFSKIL